MPAPATSWPFFDSEHHPLEPSRPIRIAPVRLGTHVWFSRSATVLPGVTIGEHAVVAARSIVTDDVPARTVVSGYQRDWSERCISWRRD
jgi:acetyltransferase-like isoleucine patch superfamily enzyme